MGQKLAGRFVRMAATAAIASGALWSAQAAAATDKGRKMCSAEQIDGYLKQARDGDRKQVVLPAFYAAAKKSGTLSIFKNEGKHFKGADAIIKHWNAEYGHADTRWLAYILATALHESRLHPVREHFGKTDEDSIRKLRAWASRHSSSNIRKNVYKYTTIDPETGFAYFGRGFVQLTWDFNYKSASKRLGIDPGDKENSYYYKPGKQLDPESSVLTLYSGMVYGWYRPTHCLLRYIYPNQNPANYRLARNIVNGGLDKTARITGYAEAFAKALAAPGVIVDASIEVAPPEVEEQEKQEKEVETLVGKAGEAAGGGRNYAALAREVAGQREVFAARIVELRALLTAEQQSNADLQARLVDQQEDLVSQKDEITRLSEQLVEAKLERDRMKATLERVAQQVERANNRSFWDYLFGSD